MSRFKGRKVVAFAYAYWWFRGMPSSQIPLMPLAT
ncbi:MAG: hypothetical protein PWQ72_1849 [Pseudothermotoga sp.]|jgi:hypothetical protein|nr:hypothetical protein [Pseudothermotoga sp.]MDK2884346.1 hypothetical protein [Pseudothermotoga sp.]